MERSSGRKKWAREELGRRKELGLCLAGGAVYAAEVSTTVTATDCTMTSNSAFGRDAEGERKWAARRSSDEEASSPERGGRWQLLSSHW